MTSMAWYYNHCIKCTNMPKNTHPAMFNILQNTVRLSIIRNIWNGILVYFCRHFSLCVCDSTKSACLNISSVQYARFMHKGIAKRQKYPKCHFWPLLLTLFNMCVYEPRKQKNLYVFCIMHAHWSFYKWTISLPIFCTQITISFFFSPTECWSYT